MANLIKWGSPTNVTAPISGASINAAAGSLGTQYDNETNKHRFASFQVTATHGTAPVAGEAWLLYFVLAQDNTNDEDGGTAVQPQKPAETFFAVRAVTSAQKVTRFSVPLPPFKFKPLLWNDTSQNATSVTLDMEVYNEEIQ